MYKKLNYLKGFKIIKVTTLFERSFQALIDLMEKKSLQTVF